MRKTTVKESVHLVQVQPEEEDSMTRTRGGLQTNSCQKLESVRVQVLRCSDFQYP